VDAMNEPPTGAADDRPVRCDGPSNGLAVRPRFIDGLVVVPLDGGLVVEGTARRQVLRGRHATSMVPRLLSLGDGTRTVDEVASALGGVPEAHVRQALTLLWSLGLMEDAAGPPVPDDTPPALAGYVRRLIGTAAGGRRTGEVLRRLIHARVLVVADELPGRLLARQLVGCVGAVDVLPADAVGRAPAEQVSEGSAPDLVVIVDGGSATALRRVVAHCSAAGLQWLRTASDAALAEIGPLVGPDDCRCHRSFSFRPATRTPRESTWQASFHEAWAALVAIEVLHVVGGIGANVGPGRIATYDLDMWEDGEVGIPHLPGCPSGLHPSRGPLPDRPRAERR
jgi:hypothetical protein